MKFRLVGLRYLSLARVLSLCAIVLAQQGLASQAWAAKDLDTKSPSASSLDDKSANTIAVYLSIREPEAVYLLSPTRILGRAYRDDLVALAASKKLDIVLPVVTDILQEALMAARIAARDTGGLRNIAAMQGAKVLLAGRLERSGAGHWSAAWSISNSAGRYRWQASGESFETLAEEAFAAARRVLAGEQNLDPHPQPKRYPVVSEDIEERLYGGPANQSRSREGPTAEEGVRHEEQDGGDAH